MVKKNIYQNKPSVKVIFNELNIKYKKQKDLKCKSNVKPTKKN